LLSDDQRYASDPDNPLTAGSPTLADAYSYNAGALGQWIAQQRAKSSQMGLWNDQTGLPTAAGIVNAGQQYGNALLMGTTAPETQAIPSVMYHGTNESSLSMHGPEVSLTPDRTQATGYANNYHKMDDEGGVDEPSQPVVHKIQVTPGSMLDINADMRRYESGKQGDNADEFISKLAQGARQDGYRYMQFNHPNMPLPGADPNGTHQVVISLHPDDDLGYSLSVMEQEAAKAKRLAK
jgi:hypothetical protein